jgi:hypothetical protein
MLTGEDMYAGAGPTSSRQASHRLSEARPAAASRDRRVAGDNAGSVVSLRDRGACQCACLAWLQHCKHMAALATIDGQAFGCTGDTGVEMPCVCPISHAYM